MKKIETSALIGLGALGILFGRKMPGVKVIADAERVARYSAQPVICNGKECHFDYVTRSRASRLTWSSWPSRLRCWNRPFRTLQSSQGRTP